MTAGTLHTVGMGPGDPDLLTLKAVRLLGRVRVVAHFARHDRHGHARSIAGAHVRPDAEELRFDYPYTTEIPHDDPRYVGEMTEFYDRCAADIALRLDRGLDVALLCEGDPFFYGSSMYLHDRLCPDYQAEVVPGITGMSGCWTRARAPITHGDDVLTVLPGTLDEAELAERLGGSDAAVIMKVGRNLPKIRAALARAGLSERAIYVERGTMDGERVMRLAEMQDTAPYFSMVLVPGRQNRR